MKKLLKVFGLLSLFTFLFFSNGFSQCLDGTCWDGNGTYLYPSGAKYVGMFRDGKINGKGTLYFSNGNKYIGNWKQFYREGEGELFYTDGGYYKGQFKKSKFNGQGYYKYPNGDTYNGNWKNNLSEGQGTYTYKGGNRYEGNFKSGKFEGKGIMFYADGTRYEGDWVRNKKEGNGKFINTSGKVKEGIWAQGKLVSSPDRQIVNSTPSKQKPSGLTNCNSNFCKNGKGEYTYRDGSRYVGTFLNGTPEGEGTCFYKNGDKYVGGWKNHAPHGEGFMYYSYGKIIGAVWEKGTIKTVLHNNKARQVIDEYVEKDVNSEVKIWAVIVGVAQYKHLQVLKYTDDDAYRYYAFLKSPEGGALPDEQIRVLIDEDATRENILRGMKQVFYQADENDVVLFYFSGHGYDGSFVPVDFDGYNNLLRHTEVKNILEKSAARHKICFADACHSGSAGNNTLAARSANYYEPINRYYKAFEQSKGGLALLLSSKGEEFSLEDGGLRQGIYSHYLMRGLKGAADTNKDKVVTIAEIHRYVYKNVRKYTANAQTPMLTGHFDQQMPVAVLR